MPFYGTRTLIVDDTEAKPNRDDVLSGPAADAWSAEIPFTDGVNPVNVFVVDIFVTDNDLEFKLVSDDGTENDAFVVTKNSFRSRDFRARGFKVRNHTPGSIGNYEVTGNYKV